MKSLKSLTISFVLILLLCCQVYALEKIPDLIGFGTDTRGAYAAANDPIICVVDDLTDDSTGIVWDAAYGTNNIGVFKGSFLSCMEELDAYTGGTWDSQAVAEKSGKIILFEQSGTIAHTAADESGTHIYDVDNYTEIRGESSPNPGILFKNIKTRISGKHDVVISHIRSRMDDEPTLADSIHDTFEIYAMDTSTYNVVMDHISASWGRDSQIDIWKAYNGSGSIYNITVANSILAEAVEPDGSSPYEYAKNMIIAASTGDGLVYNVLIDSNIFMSSYYRNPYIYGAKVILVNNYMFNNNSSDLYGKGAVHDTYITAIGNVNEAGNMSTASAGVYYFYAWTNAWSTPLSDHKIYLYGNSCDDGAQSSANDWTYVEDRTGQDIETNCKVAGDSPYNDPETFSPITWPAGLTYTAHGDVKAALTATTGSGAYPAYRDTIDTRYAEEINGTAVEPNAVLGAAPAHPTITDCAPCDELAIPANPHTVSVTGYTNLEDWLNDLATIAEGDKPEVSNVSPPDGGTGHSTTSSATWYHSEYVDDVDLEVYKAACAAVTCGDGGSVTSSDDDADFTHDMSTLDESSTYCLCIKTNYGASQGDCQEFEFTTTDNLPQTPPGNLTQVVIGEAGVAPVVVGGAGCTPVKIGQ